MDHNFDTKRLAYMVTTGGYNGFIEYWLTRSALTKINLDFLLALAVVCNNINFVKLFIKCGASAKCIDSYPLKLACTLGHKEIAEILISHGANVHADRGYCLRVAASNGHIETIKLLMANGARVDADNNHALRWCHCNDQKETVNFLLANGADKNVIKDVVPGNIYIIGCGVLETAYIITRASMDKDKKIITASKEVNAENFLNY